MSDSHWTYNIRIDVERTRPGWWRAVLTVPPNEVTPEKKYIAEGDHDYTVRDVLRRWREDEEEARLHE